MSYPVIFEDETMEIVREAEKKGKDILLKENKFNGAIHRYRKANSNYDGIYVSEWHDTSATKKWTGYNNREMAMAIYEFCNKYNVEPKLI